MSRFTPFFDNEQLDEPAADFPLHHSHSDPALAGYAEHPCPLDTIAEAVMDGIAEYAGPMPRTPAELQALVRNVMARQLQTPAFAKACREAAREELTEFGREIVRRLFALVRSHESPGLTIDALAIATRIEGSSSMADIGRTHGVSREAVRKRVNIARRDLQDAYTAAATAATA